jgi:hypothetical protein
MTGSSAYRVRRYVSFILDETYDADQQLDIIALSGQLRCDVGIDIIDIVDITVDTCSGIDGNTFVGPAVRMRRARTRSTRYRRHQSQQHQRVLYSGQMGRGGGDHRAYRLALRMSGDNIWK